MKLWILSIYFAAVAALVLPQQSEPDDADFPSPIGNDVFPIDLDTIQPPSFSLHRRAPPATSDEDWDKYIRKGALLLTQMEATDAEAGQMYNPPPSSAQSQFEKFPDDLKNWGYDVMAYDDYSDFTTSLPIKAALEGLGATYITIFNSIDGVIIAWDKKSPGHMGPQQKPPVTIFPALKSWSDMAFLQWSGLFKADESMANIKYIISSPVENDRSQALIARALQEAGKELAVFPGTSFSAESDKGKALLAAPNGVGVAYFLSQHKKQLGLKKVSKVTVFADSGVKPIPRPPSLLFSIVDVG